MGSRALSQGTGLAAGVFLVWFGTAFAVIAPPDGGPLPDAYYRVRDQYRDAFSMKHAWVEKTRRIRAEREAYFFQNPDARQLASVPRSLAVTGTMRVPVLPGRFSGVASNPVSSANLQTQLFGANATGSVSDYYTEVSYGQFTITGDVLPWTAVSHTSNYYAGISNGLEPGLANTGEFIQEILDARDPTVNFALYDNDGPDNVPNSGDDDGYVDAIVIVHSGTGGECGNSEIQSHEWQYTAWPNSGDLPYTTNDPAAGGGFIKIDDYVIAPALNCGATAPYTASEWIDIGTFCHELGHTFGLPDLYGKNGNRGVGYWGIMGLGNWNTPEKPAHPDAWTRTELGWLHPTDIGWQPTAVSVPDVEESAVAYRLPFTDERFRRSTACVIAGSYSLYCGLPVADGTARGWVSPGPGGGYGPNWYQTVERDFTYSGTGSVLFQYKYDCDTESPSTGSDTGYAIIEVNGTETVLATYAGVGAGVAAIDLTPHLAPLAGAGGTYTLKFRVVTDYSFDDADGIIDPTSSCGALAIDDVSVTGGGVTYSTGFEVYADGWHQDPAENRTSEYWLVENRQRVGFDVNLPGQGLLIWHVDDELLHAPRLLNLGGPSGNGVRGLVLEEADGQFDLNAGVASNPGEAEDVFPGPLNKTSFTSATTPSSVDNTGRSTRIQVTAIGPPGASMAATLRAGDPGPLASAVNPTNIDNDQVAVLIDVAASRLRYGATFRFVKNGVASGTATTLDSQDIVATSLEWQDATAMRGIVNVYSKAAGAWDLVVTNPDGQSFTLASAITINQIVATQLVSASLDVVSAGVRLRCELLGREPGEVLRLNRSEQEGSAGVAIADDLQPVRGESYEFVDTKVDAGATYYYLLESRLADGTVRELYRGVANVPARELVLEQNHPNPFNPTTVIRLVLPSRADVELDVYDIRGALVKRLANGMFDSGPHVVSWDGTDAHGQPVASGVYVYRLTSDRHTLSRKMILLK